MKVTNLQLQGLLMALASINNSLVHKGLLTVDEIDLACRKAEASLRARNACLRICRPQIGMPSAFR